MICRSLDYESIGRIKDEIWLTIQRENAVKEQELATLLQMNRRTLNNYLNALWAEGKIDKDGLYWLALPFKPVKSAEIRSFA